MFKKRTYLIKTLRNNKKLKKSANFSNNCNCCVSTNYAYSNLNKLNFLQRNRTTLKLNFNLITQRPIAQILSQQDIIKEKTFSKTSTMSSSSSLSSNDSNNLIYISEYESNKK